MNPIWTFIQKMGKVFGKPATKRITRPGVRPKDRCDEHAAEKLDPSGGADDGAGGYYDYEVWEDKR